MQSIKSILAIDNKCTVSVSECFIFIALSTCVKRSLLHDDSRLNCKTIHKLEQWTFQRVPFLTDCQQRHII